MKFVSGTNLDEIQKYQLYICHTITRAESLLFTRVFELKAIMNINFFPPLQLIAFVRIAQGILYTFDLEFLKRNFLLGGLVCSVYIQRIQQKVSVIVLRHYSTRFLQSSGTPGETDQVQHLNLPNEIQKQLVGIVSALGFEIVNWFECHKGIMLQADHDLRNKLSWFSFGIIDRFETARNFIQDENVSIFYRFHLACKYYFEEYVPLLFERISTENQSIFLGRLSDTRSMELWIVVLNRHAALDWGKISRYERNHFFRDNFLGIRYYFTRLQGLETRYQCIFFALGNEELHPLDLYLCLSRMTADELNSLLSRLPDRALFDLFHYFLCWPFQIIFMKVVNNFKHHINRNTFRNLVISILYKLRKGWYDYRYIDLFESLWSLMSTRYGRFVKEDEELKEVANLTLANFVNHHLV
ncbi:UNVERIFIED_CONTAM: hypothetical protein NCL1_47061 [Trichonephila clavipes]